MPSSPYRPLLPALTVSVLLHAALLLGEVKSFPLPVDVPARAISALIVAPPGDQRPVVAPPAKASSVSTRPVTRDPPPAVADRLAIVESATVSPPDAVVKAPPRDSAALVAPSATPAAAAPSGAAPAAVTGAGAGRDMVGADDLRQYRLSLASAARRFKRYPALASQRGWEGTAEVALTFSASAALPEVTLLRSSGRGVLDDQAVAMLTQAARVTIVPDGLKARTFRVVLPVQFSLDNDQ